MEFVDYYAVLNLPQNARIKEIQKAFDAIVQNPPDPELFEQCAKAYTVLINPYKRARYDKLRGVLLVIQILPRPYPNATVFEINSIQPYASIFSLIEKFKQWIQTKYDYDWSEAQAANFSYTLENAQDESYVLFRFPTKTALQGFSNFLMLNKYIKEN